MLESVGGGRGCVYVSHCQRGNEHKTDLRSFIHLVNLATSSKNHGPDLGLRVSRRLWDFNGIDNKIK